MTLTKPGPITSLDELRTHLQYAIGVELATIPTYLTAQFSLRESSNSAANEVIQSVVMEEMLHMTLAANVLNAIGGAPSTDPIPGVGVSPIPRYPTKLPFLGALPEIHLQPFSPAAVDEFIAIEAPVPAQPDPEAGGYSSIGAFYDAVASALRRLCDPEVFAEGSRRRAGCQVTSEHYYGGAGSIVDVVDLDTALAAIHEIVAEGEGLPAQSLRQTLAQHALAGAAADPELHVEDGDVEGYGWRMYSHYARFREIRFGRRYRPDQLVEDQPAGDILPVDWSAVLPMRPDPASADYRGTPAERPMAEANRVYSQLIDLLYAAFNGHPEQVAAAVPVMYELRYQSVALMHMPSPLDPTRTLGPAFEYTRTSAAAAQPPRVGASVSSRS